MTLPASGSISTAQIQAEVGDTGAITIPDANTRTLTGKSTGALVIPTDFYGKSFGGGGTTYIPVAGTYTTEDWDSVTDGITCSVSVAWTWSVTSGTSIGLSSTRVSGASGTSISFTYAPSMGITTSSKTVQVTVTSGGHTWILNLICDNSSYDPGGSQMTL